MNFERYKAQLFVEEKIGCASSVDLPYYVYEFENYKIDRRDLRILQDALVDDADAMFHKGVQTLIQALSGLDSGFESWALIKLYYATYFFLRERLARDGSAFLRCKNIYTLDIKFGESPKKRTGKFYRGDHLSIATLYSERFSDRDILLSQSIEGLNAIEWLRDKREWINYRRREFIDGIGMLGFNNKNKEFSEQVKTYCSDKLPIFCFIPDSATLALPLKFAQASVLSNEKGKNIVENNIKIIKKANLEYKSCQSFFDNL